MEKSRDVKYHNRERPACKTLKSFVEFLWTNIYYFIKNLDCSQKEDQNIKLHYISHWLWANLHLAF